SSGSMSGRYDATPSRITRTRLSAGPEPGVEPVGVRAASVDKPCSSSSEGGACRRRTCTPQGCGAYRMERSPLRPEGRWTADRGDVPMVHDATPAHAGDLRYWAVASVAGACRAGRAGRGGRVGTVTWGR